MTWRNWRFPPCNGEMENVVDAVVLCDTDGEFEESSRETQAEARTVMIKNARKTGRCVSLSTSERLSEASTNHLIAGSD
jgi:hypothetical protein